MARFGYDVIGSSRYELYRKINGSWFTVPEDGIAKSITVYIYCSFFPGSIANKVKCAIYKKSGELIGKTEEKWFEMRGGTGGWFTFNVIEGGRLEANTDYYLVMWTSGGWWSMMYDSETDKGGYMQADYNAFPDIFIVTPTDMKCSIFCTYEPIIGGVLESHAFYNTDEVGAEVEIAGVGRYRTPFFVNLSPGSYHLTARYARQTIERDIIIESGITRTENFLFKSVPTPPPAEVFGNDDWSTKKPYIQIGGRVWACRFIMKSPGIVNKLVFYTKSKGRPTRCAIYSDESNKPKNLIAVSEEVIVSDEYKWHEFVFPEPVELKAGWYWLAWFTKDGSYYTSTYLNENGEPGQLAYTDEMIYPEFPKTFPIFSRISHEIAIYASYTSTGPPMTGTLSITTKPVAGDIYVDGELKGKGSYTAEYPIGTYTVSFGDVEGYYKPSTRTVEVKEGQTTTVEGVYVPITAPPAPKPPTWLIAIPIVGLIAYFIYKKIKR